MKNKKITLCEKLLADGWFDSKEEALPWVMLRNVLIDDRPAYSLSQKISPDAEIRIREYYKKRYVNKGGLKLEGALRDLGEDPSGKTALDCGASTGGFTDCLLQHGAERVYAVDAGHGQLAGKLLSDPRVINMEKTNISDTRLLSLQPAPVLVTLDLSYLSLRTAVPVCRNILRGQGSIICLIKPVYEAGTGEIIEGYDDLYTVLISLTEFFAAEGFSVTGITDNPVRGNGGAIEFFARLLPFAGYTAPGLNGMTEAAVTRSLTLDKFKK